MRVLVFGAAGAQGGATARKLADDGHAVRGFTRTGKVPEGVEPFRGDLGDAGRVKDAFAGMTHVSLTLPMVYEPATVAAFTRNVIEGALAAGMRRLVFNTANRLPDRETGVAAFDTRRTAVRALRESGLPVVVLRPALYLENLLAPGVLADGVLRYPLPAALPLAWLCHADLAALTAAALTGDGLEGRTLDAGGPAAVTGPELAAALGARYEELDVNAFEAGLAQGMGTALAAEVAATYRWIAAATSASPPGPSAASAVRPPEPEPSPGAAALFGTGPSLGVPLMTPAAWAEARR